MPRPRKPRWIRQLPVADFYHPQGVPREEMRGVILPLESLEALRLTDVEGLDGQAAAEMMGVSQPTYSRLLAEARQTVARALVNGWAIRIEGGNYQLDERPNRSGGRGKGRRRGPGFRGRQ